MMILETSWEVANKMGGIYTVLSSRAKLMMQKHQNKVVFIGPLIDGAKPYDFIEQDVKMLCPAIKVLDTLGLKYKIGLWDIPSQPAVILVDYKPLFERKGEFYFEMWQKYGLESDKAYGDYDDSCLFSIAAAKVMQVLTEVYYEKENSKILAIFNEWQTAMGLLYSKVHNPKLKTIFITHATTVGRSIAGNNKELYKYMTAYNGDQMAGELNVVAKHCVEKLAAHNADRFATVSKLTAVEAKQLLDIDAAVLPNGFEADLVPKGIKLNNACKKARTKILEIASKLSGKDYDDDTTLALISGRYEYRNKGIDLFVESIARFKQKYQGNKKLLALVLVPAWVAEARADLKYLIDNNIKNEAPLQYPYLTHWLHNMDSDRLSAHLRHIGMDTLQDNAQIIFVPSYLYGDDNILNMSYYEVLPAFDISIFPSYYEPWGYTPHESIAFSIPTITSNFAGFGLWAKDETAKMKNNPVWVIEREDGKDYESADEIADILCDFIEMPKEERNKLRKSAKDLAKKADWEEFYNYYIELIDSLFSK